MSFSYRMFPHPSAAHQTIVTQYGRKYAATPGSFIDVADGDCDALAGNGWVKGPMVGTTAN